MMDSPDASTSDLPGLKGAFGPNLAAYYHQGDSQTAATAWPGQSTFAITRLHSDVGMPAASLPIPPEPAIHISVAIEPVPLRSFELYVEDRSVAVPYIPEYHTSVYDLQTRILCHINSAFDYIHYHVPREGLDEIARDHGIRPVENFKLGICEADVVIAQLTKNVLPFAGIRDWSSLLAVGQFSLVFGAHLIQTYGGLSRLPEVATRGLAQWQMRRASEFIREHLDGGVALASVAQECGLSASHFARSFKTSFGVSAHRWLVLRRVDMAKDLLANTQMPLVEIALQSGFFDQAAFNRTFRQVVGESPGRWRRDNTGR